MGSETAIINSLSYIFHSLILKVYYPRIWVELIKNSYLSLDIVDKSAKIRLENNNMFCISKEDKNTGLGIIFDTHASQLFNIMPYVVLRINYFLILKQLLL